MKTLAAALAAAASLLATQAHALVYDFIFQDNLTAVPAATPSSANSAIFVSPTYTFSLDTSKATGGPVAGTSFTGVSIYSGGVLVSTDTIYFSPTISAPAASAAQGGGVFTSDVPIIRTMTASGGAFNFTFTPAAFATGNGSNISFATGVFLGLDTTRNAPATLTINPAAVSAAPEPGAWLLMLGGVAAMGLMLRRRRDEGVLAG